MLFNNNIIAGSMGSRVPIIGSLQPPAQELSTVRPGKVKSYETPDSDRILVMPGRVKVGSVVSLYKKCLV